MSLSGITTAAASAPLFHDAVVCLGDRYKYGYGIPTDLPVGENDLVICTDVCTNDVDTLKMMNKTLKAVPVIIGHHEFEVESMKNYKFLLNFNKSLPSSSAGHLRVTMQAADGMRKATLPFWTQ